MRQSDVFTLILIAGIGVIAAFFACQAILGDPSEAVVSYKTINRNITSELVAPDPEIFNSASINPTIEVYVGDCEDQNRNGILEQEELEACERAATGNQEENSEEEQGSSEGE